MGIRSNPLQDSAVQVTMGAIYDRTQERLGTTDLAIIAFRRAMLHAVKAYRDQGVLPPNVEDPTLYRARGFSAMLPKDVDWVSISEPWRQAFADPVPEDYRAPAIVRD